MSYTAGMGSQGFHYLCGTMVIAGWSRQVCRTMGIAIAMLAMVLGGSLSLSAQREQVRRMPYADLKRYYLGFSVGGHVQDLRISNAGYILPSGVPMYAEVAEWNPGFSVGVLGGMVLKPGVELRISPNLQFGEKPVAFSNGTEETERVQVRSTFLSVPVQIKWAAERLNNVRPYVAGGVYGAFTLGARRDDLIRYRNLDLGLILSAGVDLYMGWFKLSPELSLSYGLTNIIQTNRPEFADDYRLHYTNAISSGRTRMISFSLHFQ